jgi:AraC family transcriptional regulator of adaptative response / DNA-3-methyladenine glycosylase II
MKGGGQLDTAACERARRSRDARFDGRFFTAVLSTGIYCRPVCPAPQPKAANVRYYATAAAAAEAGFRPCLRCRPEASPGTPAWTGAPVSVARALKLIEHSALDRSGVEDLAARLGMGSRHLRRLFVEHLGAPPVAIAQTRRVHFAKRLLDETALPVTEIAMAAGFRSIRRFNDTFRALYGKSPSQLRRKAGANASGSYTLRLEYRPPYDWDSLIAYLGPRATPGVEFVTVQEYRRTIALDGAQGTMAVRPSRKGHALEAEIRFPRPAALFRIVERVRRIFDLGADPAAIASTLKRDARLKPLVARRPGLRVPGGWDGFEVAVRAILGQQVSVKAATTLAGRLAAKFGTDSGEGLIFPAPQVLATADLNGLGLTGARARSITALAQAVVQGAALEDSAALLKVPGIGNWTVQYIAMRLGEPDAFPATDLYLRPFAAESAAWSPWRAYAAMHIWAERSSNTKDRK